MPLASAVSTFLRKNAPAASYLRNGAGIGGGGGGGGGSAVTQSFDMDAGENAYVDTPDLAADETVTDMDLRIDLAADDYSSSWQALVTRWDANPAASNDYAWVLTSGGAMTLFWIDSSDLQQSRTSSAVVPVADGSRVQLRVTLDIDNGSGGCDVTFYSRDATLPLTDNSGWVQLGTVQSLGSVSSRNAPDSTSDIQVARWYSAVPAYLKAQMYEALIVDGIDGTVIGHWSADDYTVGDTQLANAIGTAGRTWQLRGTGEIIA